MCITSGEDYIVGVLFSYIVVLYLLLFTVIIFTYCLHNFEYCNLHLFLTNNIHIKVFNLFRMWKQAFITKSQVLRGKWMLLNAIRVTHLVSEALHEYQKLTSVMQLRGLKQHAEKLSFSHRQQPFQSRPHK